MMKRTILDHRLCRCVLLGASLALAATAQPALAGNAVFAGHASSIDWADTEPYRQGELEGDFTYASSPHTNSSGFPLSVTYGLLPRVEVSAGGGGQLEDSPEQTVGGLSDVNLGLKIQLLDQEKDWATQGFEFGVKLPVANRSRGLGTGRTDYDLTWLVTKSITDRLTGLFNVGYTWIGNPSDDAMHDELHYGIAVDFAATKRLSLNGQLFASTPMGSEQDTGLGIVGMVSWRLSNRYEVHASVARGLCGITSNVTVSVGITWTFGRLADASE